MRRHEQWLHLSILPLLLAFALQAQASVQSYRIDAASTTLTVGGTLQLHVAGISGTAPEVDLTTADGREYVSFRPAVATVSADGVVSAVAPGEVEIRYQNYEQDVSEAERFARVTLQVRAAGDADSDGMPDEWETQYSLDAADPADALLDADQDGLRNVEEFAHGTNPESFDSDDDGLGDGDEVIDGSDPTHPDPSPAQRVLDERCVVAILNRVTQVHPDGSWAVTNVPITNEKVRARATCQKNGITTTGQSEFFVVTPGSTVLENIPIDFASPKPVPAQLLLSPGGVTTLNLGEELQLTATVRFSDGSTADFTDPARGTNYRSSNTDVVSVSGTGLVTALTSGAVIINATNEGALALQRVVVSGSRDSDHDGMPDDWETTNGFNPNDPSDASGDIDSDGLSNVGEYDNGSDPRTSDTDGDGIHDGLEVQLGTSPIDPSSFDLRRALTSIAIKPSSFTFTMSPMLRYLTRQLTVTGTMADGKTVDLTAAARGTVYTSSNLQIVNFENANGKAASGENGTVTITATNNGFTATASATVRQMNAPVAVIPVGGTAMNVEVGGDFAYVAAGTAGLVVVDVANRNAPMIAATLPLPAGSSANDVRLGLGFAYVAAGATGLHVIDISNPRAPVLAGSFNTPGDARDVVLGPRGIAFVADGPGGVRILDVSNAAQPVEVASFATQTEAQGVSLDGTTLVALSGYSGAFTGAGRVQFVNVSAPALPVELGFLNLNTPAVDVEARGGFAFVSAGTGGVRVVDFSNPAAASEVSRETSFYPSDVVLIDEWAFFAEELRINSVPAVKITNPPSLFYAGDLVMNSLGDPNGNGIDADERYLYLAGHDGKLYIGQHYDATDEDAVPPTATIAAPAADTTFVVADPAPIRIEVADDLGVASVRTTVNGVFAPGLSKPPYAQIVKLPENLSSVTIDVTVTDFGGNAGHASQTNVVGPDPGTTVTGRVLLAEGIGVGSVIVTALGQTATTDATGTYLIENVSTIDGSIRVSAVFTENGKTVDGASANVTPVRGGTTNIPDIVLRAGLVVRVTSTIASGTTVSEWQPVQITVVAANDPGFYIEDVYLTFNGKTYAELRSWQLPYTTTIAVRGDANLATIGARATDNAGNVALAPPLHYTLVADPGTRLTGVVKLADDTPVAGAQVSVREASLEKTGVYVNYLGWSDAAYEELSTTTDANGAYSLPAVNTFRGDVIVTAAKIVGDDVQLIGHSAPVTLVRGQTIAVPQIVAGVPAGVVGKLAVDTYSSWIDLHQKRMAVANGGAAHFFDVTDPTRPKLRGSILLSDWWWANVVSFAADGNRAVIVSDEARVFVLDVTDMSNPTFLGNLEIGSWSMPTSAIISGNLAIIAAEELILVDISDPNEPVELGRTSLPNDSNYLALSGNYVISTEWTSFGSGGSSSGISIIDISNPAAPTTVSRVALTEGVGQPVIHGTRAYFASANGVDMVDFSDPVNPVLTRNVMTLGTFETWSIGVSGNRLFVGGEEETATGRIAIGDLTTPETPAHTGNITDAQLTPYIGAWIHVNATNKFLSVLGWTRRDHPDVPENVGSAVFIVRIPEPTP
ncbi:MAG TPA: Ig-like domain-containing protein [Thermoanaerobaculia bacterium]|nr:Ig-like domain-containing protein [Thermoanaerobaculia bacterium]